MYESLEDKSIECKFCDFVGEFEYEMTGQAFLVKCPSCGKVNYKVARDKIDAMVQEIIRDSVEDIKRSKIG
jgi:uncharacterized Zn finger protein